MTDHTLQRSNPKLHYQKKAESIHFMSWDYTFTWSSNMERWWPTSWRNVNWVSTATVLEDPFLALSRNDIVVLTCILRVTRHILQGKEGGGRKEVVLVKQALIQLSILCKSFPSALELFQQISQYTFENKRLSLFIYSSRSQWHLLFNFIWNRQL